MLKPFVPLAAFGLSASMLVHVLTLLRLPSPFGEMTGLLHLGAIVVVVPTVLIAQPLLFNAKSWVDASYIFEIPFNLRGQLLLRGCPAWMRRTTTFFGAYVFICLAVLLISTRPGHTATPDTELQWFSGCWMAAYAFALSVLWSAIRVAGRDVLPRCTAGHLVWSTSVRYCQTCRRPVVDGPVSSASGYAGLARSAD